MRDRPVEGATAEACPADAGSGGAGSSRPSRRLGGNVVALGFTSMFTDVSSEMVNTILPLYLIFQLGFSPLQFGLFDGAAVGVTALLRIAGGVFADRRRRFKEVAGFGYALSAVCKLGLLVSRTWTATSGILLADRVGKGVRTAPRDALISHSSPPGRLGEAFGVHRTLDTAGALLGPFVAFVLLGFAPRAYDTVFVTSFFVALIGLAVLVCFVRNVVPPGGSAVPKPPAPAATPASWRQAMGLLRMPQFRRLVTAGGLLAAVTVSDAFLYLVLQRQTGMTSRPFPLLFVGTALVYLLLAVPLGRLADRVGRVRVFLGGQVLLLGGYAALSAAGNGWFWIPALLALLGTYYAASDGVLMAMAASALPAGVRTTGLAVLTTVTALARLAASVAFGLCWTWWGPGAAVTMFAAGLALAIPAAWRILSADREVSVA